MSQPSGYNPSSRLEDTATEYLTWMLTPPVEREPKTKKAFAEVQGIALKTLYNWEHSEWFQRQIRLARAPLFASWYGDIVGRMKEIIDTGIAKDAIAAARVLLPHLDVPEAESAGVIDKEELKRVLKSLGMTITEDAQD